MCKEKKLCSPIRINHEAFGTIANTSKKKKNSLESSVWTWMLQKKREEREEFF